MMRLKVIYKKKIKIIKIIKKSIKNNEKILHNNFKKFLFMIMKKFMKKYQWQYNIAIKYKYKIKAANL